MSFLKGILRFLKKILDTIKKVLKKIFSRFGILLLIFVVCCFVFPALLPALFTLIGAPAWLIGAATTFGTAVAAWGLTAQVAVGVGLVAMVAPHVVKKASDNVADSANHVVDNVGDIGGNIVDNGGEIIGGIVDNVADVVFSPSFLLLGGAAIGLYLLLRKKEPDYTANINAMDPADNKNVGSYGPTYALPSPELEDTQWQS